MTSSQRHYVEVIVYLTSGEPFDDLWWSEVGDSYDEKYDIIIDVCNLAYKWDIKPLFNLAMKAFAHVYELTSSEPMSWGQEFKCCASRIVY